uniref:N-acetyltransferase domain-containing protein n=1 Tax=Pyrodinium bahamense TaxID=73915 RepID=A0A7S0AMK8_9DINO|mmetsp:Transcript_37710/g.105029  ORF Transcript_37710/g.105029 Transcript_37710/m.105029 type:complete len:173 (+) Transcript_37710:81-599(+)|eukprot:CAMPEP_0179089968 /NCGR_PEP_ID=MMETSP0796-20121207/41021_1 /TAXON_ID=73915 /ORGANISM="Pyrodinium bahamense, Strain pbaha01" /LENGTH=172 /DNA_ID=CAMNT_0020787531 /DNA_START=75 /DNA_END=593 /DNA_ORIENTATION=-
MKTPYEIQFEAFAAAGPPYDERHAKLYAQLAEDMIADGSFSIVHEGVAHACYTPLTIDKAPELKCFVLAPLAVLPGFQRKGLATRLMEEAEKQLGADVVFVMGDPSHYARRYSTPHKVSPPVKTEAPPEVWFARAVTPGALDGVPESTSTILGPYANPIMWAHPSEQVAAMQ